MQQLQRQDKSLAGTLGSPEEWATEISPVFDRTTESGIWYRGGCLSA